MSKLAACYIRVSTEDQTEYSPDAQLAAISKFAAANGVFIPQEFIFIDAGFSGRRAEKRPAFMEMIAKAKTKPRPFELILVHKFDRFARSREDSVVFKSLLKKECGVRVVSITESIEDDKFSIILEAMLEAMAEYYSINLGEEVKKGMTEKAHRGELQCTPPFGFSVQNNCLQPIDAEAGAVREIFRRFTAGEGYFQIARYLNKAGFKTHRGNAFDCRAVEYIVRNPVYIGKLRWNPDGRTRRDFDSSSLITADAGHQGLIDEELWECAQARARDVKKKHKPKSRPKSEYRHILSGLLRCSECGAGLVFTSPHYFKCGNYAKGRCSHSQHTSAELLKNAVLSRLDTDLAPNLPIKFTPAGKSADNSVKNSLKHRITALNNMLPRLREAYLCGAESAEEYKAEKERILQEIADTEAELEKLVPAENTFDSSCISQPVSTLIERAPVGKACIALHEIIDKCVWNKEQLQLDIYYHK